MCSLCPGHRDGDVNERDVIPALGWKLARSSGKPSLWGSSCLSWSELHPFKDFWAKPASPRRQKPPPSLPLILSPWCSRLSPRSLLPKLRGGPLLPLLLLPILGLFGLSLDARMVEGGASGLGGGQQLKCLQPRAQKGTPRSLVGRCWMSPASLALGRVP